ncbi:hypothetical protein [Sphingomonas mesophila]|uniref:hypothetical protein n=1 Tax=Sphingomonas mesophila TaxID=2303576 RepID=UPI000E5784D6|nr:hypothetical protein [Sphingomonas mesophila]
MTDPTDPPRTFSLKDPTSFSGNRHRGRFLRGLSEADWPAIVPVPVAESGDAERVMPTPYDAAVNEAARNGWWWAKSRD